MKTDWSRDDAQRHARRAASSGSPRACSLTASMILTVLVPDWRRTSSETACLAVEHVPGAGLGEAVLDAAEVADADRGCRPTLRHDDVAELRDRVDPAQRADPELGVAAHDRAARDLHVLVLDRALDVDDGEAVGGQLVGVERRRGSGAARAPVRLDLAHAVHRLEHALDLLVGDLASSRAGCASPATTSVITGSESGSAFWMTGGRMFGGRSRSAPATFSRTSWAALSMSRSSTNWQRDAGAALGGGGASARRGR